VSVPELLQAVSCIGKLRPEFGYHEQEIFLI
jgi:hypothetical protein